MNNFSTWLTVTMLVIFTTMVLIATSYPAGARFMPFVVGIPGMMMCMFQIGMDWLSSHRAKLAAHFQSAPRAGQHHLDEYPTAEPTEEEEAALPEFGPHTVKAEITIWVYFLVFIVAVLLLGFLVSVPVMVATYLWREADVRPIWAIAAGLVCTTAIYLMFERLLHLQLHGGFVTTALLKAAGV